MVIYSDDLHVLLLERVRNPSFWQSVTGSRGSAHEAFADTAIREVAEETGIDARKYPLVDWKISNQFEIFLHWRNRYAPGVTHNTEHVFGLTLPAPVDIALSAEHVAYQWQPWREAAEKVFSWTNRDAILMLPERSGHGQ